MHGYVVYEFKQFICDCYGEQIWNNLNLKLGGKYNMVLAVSTYPDEEVVKLLTSAAEIIGQPATSVLQDFGTYISKDLIEGYKVFIKPEWKTIDLLENTEYTIHSVVRRKQSGTPPHLKVQRLSPKEINITYQSARKMCHFAKGIILGIAKHYRETVDIRESVCMHNGANQCLINVSKIG